MKSLEITPEKGWEVDEEKSTFKNIVFKEIETPKYVECIECESDTKSIILGQIFPVLDHNRFQQVRLFSYDNYYFPMVGGVWSFKPSTKEAYEAQQKKAEQDELLEECKKLYTVGTRFRPAHCNPDSDVVCIVTNTDFKNIDGYRVVALTDEGLEYENTSKYGNTNYNRNVYQDGKFAEIIPESKETINFDGVDYSPETLRSLIKKATT